MNQNCFAFCFCAVAVTVVDFRFNIIEFFDKKIQSQK